VSDLLKTLGSVGKNFKSKTHSLFIDRKELVVVKKEKMDKVELEIVENASALLHPIVLKFFKSDKLDKQKGNNLGQFDIRKLKFPLKLRNWEEGDKMSVLGMKGTKKVSDILIDKKVSIADKRFVMVLESDGEIIWVPGVSMSEKGKVDKNTKNIWCAELQESN
jgi:tRNA(Ile)-lysidine synthase